MEPIRTGVVLCRRLIEVVRRLSCCKLTTQMDGMEAKGTFTSRYAHPGTATPAGIGSGYLP